MNAHVEPELLAYLDGELDERERARVEAHLDECPFCAAELGRLRVLRQELASTFDAALGPVRLPPEADARIRQHLRSCTETRPWSESMKGLWQRRGLLLQATLAVLVLIFTFSTTQVLDVPLPAAPHETLVLGQEQLAPGSEAALRVIVRSVEKDLTEPTPVAGAGVVVRLGRTPGLASTVFTGRTDAHGTANVAFTVPADLAGAASLVVETTHAGVRDEIVHPITIARDYKLYLSPDKPAYRPGQTIRLRTLALDSVDLKPVVDQDVTFTLAGPGQDGEDLASGIETTSEFGVAYLDFPLPPEARPGQYTLRASLGGTRSERTVTVDTYELPSFRVTLTTDQDFYTPGGRVTGYVEAGYFFGRPVVDGRVTLYGYAEASGRGHAIQITGWTDEHGVCDFAFDLPAGFGATATDQPAQFNLEAQVVDQAGQQAGIRDFLPVAAQSILINAIPESGRLKPGIENVVYVLTSRPTGQPIPTSLTIQANGETQTLQTGPYGLAEFRYTPTGPETTLSVHAKDEQGHREKATFRFESDRAPRTLLLRAERAAYEVGDTLRVEALTAGYPETPGPTIYLDVVRARQTIATLSALAEGGRATFALDLDGTMVGTLELHAYVLLPGGDVARDTRLVIVDAPQQVNVAIESEDPAGGYRPGDTARLQFRTTLDPSDRPVQAALGIGVVDESVYALQDQPPGFVRAYFLLEEEIRERGDPRLDVLTLLEDLDDEARDAQDVAARAAWAGVEGARFSLLETSFAQPTDLPDEASLAARAALARWLGLALVALPLILCVVVVRGLAPSGILGLALRRVGIGGLLLLLASPLLAIVVGGLMWLLWVAIGVGAPILLLLVIAVLLTGVLVHGWRRRDTRVQLSTGILAAYLVLTGLLVVLAARGGDLSSALLVLIVAAFLLTVAALVLLGQGLLLEGWPRVGWTTTSLALLLIPLAVYLPFVPALSSDLTRSLGNSALYAGPVGWLTGCGMVEPVATQIQKEVDITALPEVVEVTREVEVEVQVPVEQEEVIGTATPLPAAEFTAEPPMPLPTAPSLPQEPYPLRQVFPETLYWAPEVITDEDGRLSLDLPLADNVTTWRLTALASTREGTLGVAVYDIPVFQGLFTELTLPDRIVQGEAFTATLTVYNFQPAAQVLEVEPAPAHWYTLYAPALRQTFDLPPGGVAVVQFVVRPEEAGTFSLQVTAASDDASDTISREVMVQPQP
ncbi:MAG TPA: hypothetical protein ENN19_00665 [Chloroflexi bacterium]|nr:hypothetical protein [Chloroflexota bacterium]